MKTVTRIPGHSECFNVPVKLRVAAYCRVSTDSSEQQESLEMQKTHYESIIMANTDWEFVGLYCDEGISGTKLLRRAGLLKLLADCENGKVDFILTKSISRFSRSTTDCLETVRRLTELGVFINFEKENINTKTMDGELMLSVLSSLAENESISLSENVKWSITRRFKNGSYKHASAPYGYDRNNGKLVVNNEQAVIVRRIFAAALSGKGTQKIADSLNSEGLLPKRGTHWTGCTVLGMLSNEKYVGDVLLQKTYTDDSFTRHHNYGTRDQYLATNQHEAIISRKDFKIVTELIKRNGEAKGVEKGGKKYQNRYAFSGKIRCAECGSNFKRMTQKKGDKKVISWSCAGHIKDVSACSMQILNEDIIHQAFITMINKLRFGHMYVLKPLLQSMKAVNLSDNLEQIQALETGLEINADRSAVLIGLMTKNYLDPALFNMQMNELRREADSLKARKEALSRSVNGEITIQSELEKLMKFLTRMETPIECFDDWVFTSFVDSVLVYSLEEIGFKLRCGITLKERLVR